jgi:hypothetical protein
MKKTVLNSKEVKNTACVVLPKYCLCATKSDFLKKFNFSVN